MVRLIVGKKGTGKTKTLLDSVNAAINAEHGNIVFIHLGNRHGYHLSHTVRVIDAGEYDISTYREFISFINGAISQNYDITHIFIDGLLKIVKGDLEGLPAFVNQLKSLCKDHGIKFTVTVSADKSELSEEVYDCLA